MAILRPDEYQHNNSALAVVDSIFTRGGLKQLADFTTVTLATLNVDQLKEGNLLYITAGANEGNLYKLIDISNHALTANWEKIIASSDIIDEDNMVSNLDTKIPSQQSVKAYTDNGDNKVTQAFTTVTDANASIDFNSEDFTKNYRLNTITADRTWTISNAVSGSQLFIVVNVGSGEQDWELIFSGMSSMNIHPDWINGTSDGVIFPGNASAATKYQVIAVYDGTDWWINAIDWN